MSEWARQRLTYANVMATFAVFLALGLGGAWAAGKLGKNSVKSKQIANGQVKGVDLADDSVTSPKVLDGSLHGEDFAAGEVPQGPQGVPGPKGEQGIQGPPGQDGQDGQPGPSATKIDVSVSNGSTQDVTVGGFTLRFECSGDAAHRLFTLGVPGGSGGAQLVGVKSISDTSGSTIPFATGAAVPSGQFVGIGVGQPNPNNTSGFFYRLGGTLVLHNGLTVTTVVFDMFLENRSNQGTCLFRGTGVHSA